MLKLEIPPLRHRKGDIPLLCQSFLDNLNRKNTDTVRTFSPQFLRLLQQLDWPGNVRELQNAVVKAFHMCSGNVIDENIIEMIYPNAISETPERAFPYGAGGIPYDPGGTGGGGSGAVPRRAGAAHEPFHDLQKNCEIPLADRQSRSMRGM